MVYKGYVGKRIEKYLLKVRYNIEYCPKNSPYDLPLGLNNITYKNVSIKCSKNNTILCGDVFNFLDSIFLELIIVSYKVVNKQIQVLNYYLFSELDLFFISLKKYLDLEKLIQLYSYLQSLKYPFSEYQRYWCHTQAKSVLKREFCGFHINVRLSKTNKRIQCSLKLDQVLEKVKFEYLQLQKDFKW